MKLFCICIYAHGSYGLLHEIQYLSKISICIDSAQTPLTANITKSFDKQQTDKEVSVVITQCYMLCLYIQYNFNGSNTFGTMKICSKQR